MSDRKMTIPNTGQIEVLCDKFKKKKLTQSYYNKMKSKIQKN